MPMKTITEFSGSVLAAAARFVAAPIPAATDPAAPRSPTVGQAAAPDAGPVEAAETSATPATPTATVDEEGLRATLGISGDRLARLLEALTVVGSRLAQVTKVRVLSGDQAPPAGAKKVGDFYFVVDAMTRGEKDGRRGGRGRGARDERRNDGAARGAGGGRGASGRSGGGRGRDGFEREPPRNEVPATGVGWVLQRAPKDPNDHRGGDRRGPGSPGGRRPSGGGRRPGGDQRGPGTSGRGRGESGTSPKSGGSGGPGPGSSGAGP